MQLNLPYSNEAETTLLGNFTLYPESLITAIENGLVSDDFFINRNKLIFQCMIDLRESNTDCDLTSLSQRLKDYNLLEQIGGLEYLINIQTNAVGNKSIDYYINILKTKSYARNLINLAKKIGDDATDGSKDINDTLDEAEKNILEITRNRYVKDFRDSSEAIDNVLDNLKRINSGKNPAGIKTTFRDLDYKTNGFQRGDLIILAARPSVGKTAFALNMALNISGIDNGQLGAVAIFSLEMSAEQLISRMLSARSKIPGEKIRTARFNDDEWNKLNYVASNLKKEKIYIDDTPAIKVAEIFSKCRKLKAKEGLACVLIDYIQLIGTSNKRSESRQQEVSEISRSLKALAREMEVPVIALSQLSRSVEKRDDKRPMLSDLRESGALEQDADIVMFLYREEYYKKDKIESNDQIVELTLAKHRNGPTGQIKLSFQKDINQFISVDEKYSDSESGA